MSSEAGITREIFLLRALLVAGAAAAGPLASRALAKSGGGDLAIVRFMLLLEQLEVAMFRHGLTLALTSGLKGAAQDLLNDDIAHVAALEETVRALGATPAPPPAFHFEARGEQGFLPTAVAVEDLAVSAYNGVAPLVESKDILRTTAAIVGVEGRHAATIRLGAGLPPAPVAFDPAKEQAEAKDAINLWLPQ